MKQLKPLSLLANMILAYLEELWEDPEESQEAIDVMNALSSLENDGWNDEVVRSFQNAIAGLDGLSQKQKIDFVELLIKNYKPRT